MSAASASRQVHVEHVMGTVVSIDVRSEGPAREAIADVVAWLHQVDATFSTYREDSAIRRLDRGAMSLAEAGLDVRRVLERCEWLRRRTEGFFDARARDGSLDPSALVKGWALQRGADMLVAAGAADFCLTGGGDVVTRGEAAPGAPWLVGVQHPRDRSALAAVIRARDLAVATSGTYERGDHIVDPHRGRPPAGVASVTVTGPDLGLADAFATAAFAMGTAGPRWTLGLDGYEAMTVLDGDVVLRTPCFPPDVAGA
jgi:thiamine biosynthesis lipoprotein